MWGLQGCHSFNCLVKLGTEYGMIHVTTSVEKLAPSQRCYNNPTKSS